MGPLMPDPRAETDDWKLSCTLDWKAKEHQEVCPMCKGRREVGGGFGDIDGAQPCPTCYGHGFKMVGPKTPRPPIPPDLREYLRRAWWDFFNPGTPLPPTPKVPTEDET